MKTCFPRHAKTSVNRQEVLVIQVSSETAYWRNHERRNLLSLRREPQLAGQTLIVIGGSAGIGLETARLVRTEGAKLVLAARNAERLQQVARELAAQSTAAFDATDFEGLAQFFDELPTPIDHVLVTGPGPYYAPLAEFDFEKARRDVEAHLLLPLQVARHAANKVRPGGTLLFMGGTGGRHTAKGFALISALTAAMPAMTNTALTGATYDIDGGQQFVEG